MASRRARLSFSIATLAFVSVSSMFAVQRGVSAAEKSVPGRITMEGGGLMPRFTLPVQSPGRPTSSITINPQPDGSFSVVLPMGISIIGAPSGLAQGYVVRNLTYGTTDLLTVPLVVAQTDNAEIRITLRAASLVNVSGRVTGLTSTAGILILLQGTPMEALVGADGSFSFTNIPPGNYQLRVISNLIMQQFVPITVAGANVTGVTIAMPQERYVTGRVVVEGSDAQPPTISAEARSADGRVVSSSSPAAYQGTNTGQFFNFRLRSGEYTVSIRTIPAGYQLKSLTYGTVDLLKQPLKLDGTAAWNIVARLIPDRR